MLTACPKDSSAIIPLMHVGTPSPSSSLRACTRFLTQGRMHAAKSDRCLLDEVAKTSHHDLMRGTVNCRMEAHRSIMPTARPVTLLGRTEAGESNRCQNLQIMARIIMRLRGLRKVSASATMDDSQARSSPKLASLTLFVLATRLRSPVHNSATNTSLLCDDSSGPFRRKEN
jgi:hypothetical protein